jgi:hypothetical protein
MVNADLKSMLYRHAKLLQTLALYRQLQELDAENAPSLRSLAARAESQVAVLEVEIGRMVRT